MFWYWIIGLALMVVYLCWEYTQAKDEFVVTGETVFISIVIVVLGGAFALMSCMFGLMVLVAMCVERIPPVRIVIKKSEK